MIDVTRVFLWGLLACCGLALLAGGAGGAGAETDLSDATLFSSNDSDRPLAEAGLDQSVDQYVTVYLDAGGSHVPDGDIATYEWVIERPNATLTTPACSTCEQTHFPATQNGTYAVTLTVTDTTGRTDSDTMYVHVSQRIPPDATIDGPDRLNVSEPGQFDLDASPGTYPLQSVQWVKDGDPQQGHLIDDAGADIWHQEFAFDDSGRKTVTADVLDESGFPVTATHDVSVGNYSHFAVSITNTTSPVEAGDPARVTAHIENTGNRADTQLLTLEDASGNPLATQPLTLAPGETAERTLDWEACLDTGTHPLTVTSHDDADTATLDVTPGACTTAHLAIDSLDAPDVVVEGEPVDVTATLLETAGVDTTQDVLLSSIESDWVDTQEVSLAGGTHGGVDLHWQTERGDAGHGNLTVATRDDTATHPLVVLEAPTFAVDITAVEESTPSGALTVEATITNTGEVTDTQAIRLTREGASTTLDTHDSLTLAGNDSATVSLTWEDASDHPGEHTLIVSSDDDADTAVVESEEPEGVSSPYYTGAFADPPTELEQGNSLYPDVTVTDYTIHFETSARQTAHEYTVTEVWESAPPASKWAIDNDHPAIATPSTTGRIRALDDAPPGETVTVCVRGHQHDSTTPYTAGTSQWSAPGWNTFGLDPQNDCTTLVIVEETDNEW